MVLIAVFSGPSRVDDQESIYSTWAIAHGQIVCAYPPVSLPSEPLVAPLYPLISGGIAAITRIGHDVPFPFGRRLGAWL